MSKFARTTHFSIKCLEKKSNLHFESAPKEYKMCPACSKSIAIKNYEKHSKKCRFFEIDPIACDICSDLFPTQSSFEDHNRLIHNANENQKKIKTGNLEKMKKGVDG